MRACLALSLSLGSRKASGKPLGGASRQLLEAPWKLQMLFLLVDFRRRHLRRRRRRHRRRRPRPRPRRRRRLLLVGSSSVEVFVSFFVSGVLEAPRPHGRIRPEILAGTASLDTGSEPHRKPKESQ